jgi:hypothetical protein
LHDGPVRQDIRGHVYFTLGAIDKRHVDVFEVFSGRVVNGRRGLGTARRERGEEKACRDATACYLRATPAIFALEGIMRNVPLSH